MVGNGAAAAMEVASSAATCGGLPLSTLKTKFPVSACTSNDNTDDRGWALKRDWTDSDFQEGADKNREQLQSFEDVLVARLRQSCARHIGGETPAVLDDKGNDACEIGKDEREQVEKEAKIDGKADNVLARALRPLAPSSDKDPPAHVRDAVLNDPAVLGSSLDIVGAYLKNYEVDKAAAVIETVLPACRSRGGLWYLKALNHLATVRMKQARPTEALSTLSEIESYALLSLRPEEMDEAWEFWETVYRNFGWALSSLDRETEAIGYIQRAIGVKERVGKAASWFDLWDLGRMQACSALRTNNSKEIQESQAVVTKALWLHRDAEASDLVMRAKIWHSVGECSFALGHLTEVRPGGSSSSLENPNAKASSSQARTHYTKALKCLKEAHKLFMKTEGRYNPLTGGEAQAVSWTLLKLGLAEEAKAFLLDALESASRQQSGWGDGTSPDATAPAMLNAMQTVDRILEAHRMTEDRAGLERYFPAVERLCANIHERLRLSKERTDAPVYEKLVSSCSMVMVASNTDDGVARSQRLLRDYMWERPNTPQAQLCSEMMTALKNGDASGRGGGIPPTGPGTDAFMRALAQQGLPSGLRR